MNASRPGMGGATPVLVNGEVQGLRLLGISTRSPAYWLGLRTGDQIASIDDAPLKNAQVLLDMFAKLDQVSTVEIGGTRRAGKQPLKLTLKLR
jgi:S1-C subfamily serine protease